MENILPRSWHVPKQDGADPNRDRKGKKKWEAEDVRRYSILNKQNTTPVNHLHLLPHSSL